MTGRKQFDVDVAIDVATRVFWQRGYDAASVQDLVDATGLGRGSLYGTFGDKQALFLACLDRYTCTVAARLLDALHTHPDDPAAALAAMYDAILVRMADPGQPSGCLITLSAAESATLPDRAREKVRELLAAQVRAVADVLRAGATAGHRPHGGDPDTLADYLVGVAQTLALMHRAGSELATLHGVATTALHVLQPRGGPAAHTPVHPSP